MTKLVLVFAACVFGAGCGSKDRYPITCKKPVELTAPWTEFGFPTDRGRVCESGSDRAQYMFLDAKADEVTKVFADAVLAKGYKKDSCSSLACRYHNTTEQITIQPYESTRGKPSYVTVSLRRRPLIK